MLKPLLRHPWLIADLGGTRRVLSFALHRPGFVAARRVVWREVRNADLTPDFDADAWFAGQLAQEGLSDAVGMLTSRDIGRFVLAKAEVEGVVASCLATVGLGNAERVGSRHGLRSGGFGTINLVVQVSAGLADAAMIEALTIAAEARTAAVIDSGRRVDGATATGTGTDCIVLAADEGQVAFAGLHTAVGEAVGAAVYRAVLDGAAEWMREHGEGQGPKAAAPP